MIMQWPEGLPAKRKKRMLDTVGQGEACPSGASGRSHLGELGMCLLSLALAAGQPCLRPGFPPG